MSLQHLLFQLPPPACEACTPGNVMSFDSHNAHLVEGDMLPITESTSQHQPCVVIFIRVAQVGDGGEVESKSHRHAGHQGVVATAGCDQQAMPRWYGVAFNGEK